MRGLTGRPALLSNAPALTEIVTAGQDHEESEQENL